MSWLLNRLREPSTWRGIVWLLTVAGWSLRPDQAEAIVTFGITLIGLIGVFLPDAQPQPALPPIELQSHGKTTLLFLIAVLLTPGLTLMLGGCAWSCQPTLALKPSMSAAHIKTFPAGAVESLGLGCERRL